MEVEGYVQLVLEGAVHPLFASFLTGLQLY